MSLAEHHVQTAKLIDDFVTSVFARGGDESDLLRQMVDYMPAFKTLMDSATSAQMDALCQRFKGLSVFASILESMAEGIARGEIAVPPKPEPKNPVDTIQPLPTLTVNRTFMQAFLDAPTPCFALGLVEERQQQRGLLALRPDTPLPPTSLNGGFRFGHSLLGTASFEVVQFAFEFAGFGTYNVLINPNNPLVQAVLDSLLEQQDYFFFALDADHRVTAFRADIGDDNLVGLKTHGARLAGSTTTLAQYDNALAQFARHPQPKGTLLTWVCRACEEALDLTQDRLTLNPSA